MQVISTVSGSIDQSVIEAFEEMRGPIRIRLQPAVLRRPESRKEYRAWRDLHWMVEIETLEEAQGFREAMTSFFDRLKRDGVTELQKYLSAPPTTT